MVVLEQGVKYYVQPEDGQKTGFYADQRDNRHRIRLLSHNKTVLDTFCYSGGTYHVILSLSIFLSLSTIS